MLQTQGRGLGRACVRLLKQLAFRDLHAHRFWLDVKSLNARALRLYASEGFVEEGRLRESVRVGTDDAAGWDSLVVMSLLDREYQARVDAGARRRRSRGTRHEAPAADRRRASSRWSPARWPRATPCPKRAPRARSTRADAPSADRRCRTPRPRRSCPVAGKPVLWGYVDGAGVAHFASSQIDSRYDQVLRETDGRRVLGKTQGTDGLLDLARDLARRARRCSRCSTRPRRRTGVDEELLKAVITVESNYNAHAVSPRGARRPDAADAGDGRPLRHARKSARRRPPQRMLDARTNVLTGARMLADLTRRYGGIDIALAAWNAGEGTVRKAGGQMPDIAETEAHVHMVLELYWALLQRKLPQHAHGVEVVSCAPAVCGR